MKKLILAVAVLFLFATPAFCDIINVTVAEDTFIDSFYANIAMGADNSTYKEKLWVGDTVDLDSGTIKNDTTRAYLKFNLNGYSDITSASLNILKCQSGTQGWDDKFNNTLGIGFGNITVYRYKGSQTWNEQTLTWANAPGVFTNTSIYVPGGSKYVNDTTTWVSFNATSFAKNAVGGNLTLVLASDDPFSIYYSSENTDDSDFAPYLKVNGTAVPEPISATLFLFGAGALGARLFRRKKQA